MSDYWRWLKDLVCIRAAHRCEFCGKRPIWDLHHRTYARRGRERIEDVMAVCRRCHTAIHFGGKVLAETGSLASRGDSGHGSPPLWLDYLAGVAHRLVSPIRASVESPF